MPKELSPGKPTTSLLAGGEGPDGEVGSSAPQGAGTDRGTIQRPSRGSQPSRTRCAARRAVRAAHHPIGVRRRPRPPLTSTLVCAGQPRVALPAVSPRNSPSREHPAGGPKNAPKNALREPPRRPCPRRSSPANASAHATNSPTWPTRACHEPFTDHGLTFIDRDRSVRPLMRIDTDHHHRDPPAQQRDRDRGGHS